MDDLHQVAARGAPAQQAEARRLLMILTSAPGDEDARRAGHHLVDAYLHDPYLEKD